MSAAVPAHARGWEADVALRDGGAAHVRPITPDDAEALQAFHVAQSPQSTYLRFFAAMPRLSDRDLRRFTQVDHHDRVALVVLVAESIIGVGRYDRIDASTAEVAFNISDAHQGRGVGSVLLEHLAAAALEQGINRFVAEVLPENRKMVGVFQEAGYEVSRHLDDGIVSLHFDIDPTERSLAVMAAREHRAEALSLRALLHPASVVLVGASRRPGSIGGRLLRDLVDAGFTGELHVVHPELDRVQGVPARRSVVEVSASLPPGATVDLAIIAVPAEAVAEVVAQCALLGVRGLVVVSSGFAETGAEGLAMQRDVVRLARGHGMRVVGPNSFGVLNTDPTVALNASLAPVVPGDGALGLFSQSGALGVAVLDAARRRHLGVSTFVSAGNRADVSGNDCMHYWQSDPRTTAVGMYLESVGNPRKFSRVARQLAREKPVIVVKSGVSGYSAPPGHAVRESRAPREALDALLRQAGVIRVENLHQLFDVAQLLVHQPLPRGQRVGIVGNSDALAALAAEAAVSWGLEVAPPVTVHPEASAEEFTEALRRVFADPDVDAVVASFIPPLAAVDVEVARAVRDVAAASDKPCVTCLLGMRGVVGELEDSAPLGAPGRTAATATGPTSAGPMTGAVRAVPAPGTTTAPLPTTAPTTPPTTPPTAAAAAAARTTAPLEPATATGPLHVIPGAGPALGDAAGAGDARVVTSLGGPRAVPAYPTPEDAVRALAATVRYAEWRRRDPGHRVDPPGTDRRRARLMVDAWLAERTREDEPLVLAPADRDALLACYGIPVWPVERVRDAEEAVAAAARVGYPVVLKATERHLRHPGLGGVRLDIAGPAELRQDVAQMQRQVGIEALLVQRMAPTGIAVLLRSMEDPLFGPLVSFGLAGDTSVLLGDMTHRVPPLTDVDVADLVRTLRASPRLFGYQGTPPVDVGALEDLIARVSVMADDLPEVTSSEFSPVQVTTSGLHVLNCVVTLAVPASRKDTGRRALPS